MLTITLNGHEEKLHIGCRTFISLAEILTIFEAADREVSLNGEKVGSHEFEKTIVNGGDKLVLAE